MRFWKKGGKEKHFRNSTVENIFIMEVNMFWPVAFIRSEVRITYWKVTLELEGIAQGHFGGANACWEKKLKKHWVLTGTGALRTGHIGRNIALLFFQPFDKGETCDSVHYWRKKKFAKKFCTARAFIQPDDIEHHPCLLVSPLRGFQSYFSPVAVTLCKKFPGTTYWEVSVNKYVNIFVYIYLYKRLIQIKCLCAL